MVESSVAKTSSFQIQVLDDDEVLSVESQPERADRDESLSVFEEDGEGGQDPDYRIKNKHPLALIETDDRVKYRHSDTSLEFQESCIVEPEEAPTQTVVSTPADPLREKLRTIENKATNSPNTHDLVNDRRMSRRGSPGLSNFRSFLPSSDSRSLSPQYVTRRLSTGDCPINRTPNLIVSRRRSYLDAPSTVINTAEIPVAADQLMESQAHSRPRAHSMAVHEDRYFQHQKRIRLRESIDAAIPLGVSEDARRHLSIPDDDVASRPTQFETIIQNRSTCGPVDQLRQQTLGARSRAGSAGCDGTSDYQASLESSAKSNSSVQLISMTTAGERNSGGSLGHGRPAHLTEQARNNTGSRLTKSDETKGSRKNLSSRTKPRSVVYNAIESSNSLKINADSTDANKTAGGDTFIPLNTGFNEDEESQPISLSRRASFRRTRAYSVTVGHDAQIQKQRRITGGGGLVTTTPPSGDQNVDRPNPFPNSGVPTQPSTYPVSAESSIQANKCGKEAFGRSASMTTQESVEGEIRRKLSLCEKTVTQPIAHSTAGKGGEKSRKEKKSECSSGANPSIGAPIDKSVGAGEQRQETSGRRHSRIPRRRGSAGEHVKRRYSLSDDEVSSQPGAYPVRAKDDARLRKTIVTARPRSMIRTAAVDKGKRRRSLSNDETTTRPGAYAMGAKEGIHLEKQRNLGRRNSATAKVSFLARKDVTRHRSFSGAGEEGRPGAYSITATTDRHIQTRKGTQKERNQATTPNKGVQIQNLSHVQSRRHIGGILSKSSTEQSVTSSEDGGNEGIRGNRKRSVLATSLDRRQLKTQLDHETDDERSSDTENEIVSPGPGAFSMGNEGLQHKIFVKGVGRHQRTRSSARDSTQALLRFRSFKASNANQTMNKVNPANAQDSVNHQVLNAGYEFNVKNQSRGLNCKGDSVDTDPDQEQPRSRSPVPGVYSLTTSEVERILLRKGTRRSSTLGYDTSSGDDAGLSLAPSTDDDEGNSDAHQSRLDREMAEREKAKKSNWVNPFSADKDDDSISDEEMELELMCRRGVGARNLPEGRTRSRADEEMLKAKNPNWVDPFEEDQEMSAQTGEIGAELENDSSRDTEHFFGPIPERYMDRDDEQPSQHIINAPISRASSEVRSLHSASSKESSTESSFLCQCCKYLSALLVMVCLVLGVALGLAFQERRTDIVVFPSESPTSFVPLTEWIQLVESCDNNGILEAESIAPDTLELGWNITLALGIEGTVHLGSTIECSPNSLAVLALAMSQVSSVDASPEQADCSSDGKASGAESSQCNNSVVDPLSTRQDPLWVRYVLSVTFFATMGQSWKHRENWLSGVEPCSWYGVVCAGDFNVTELSVGKQGDIGGTLPDELYQLTELRVLSIEENGVAGTISSDIGMLEKLEILDLSASRLRGTIPQEVTSLTRLREFRAEGYGLEAPLPVGWEVLSDLEVFELSTDTIGAPFPAGLPLLTNLVEISILGGLSGTIPPAMWRLPKLKKIELDNHPFLIGEIPDDAFFNKTELQIVYIYNTGLEGSIPTSIGDVSSLRSFHVAGNTRISGAIPSEIGQCTNLSMLEVHENSLRGIIPSEMGLLTLLREFNAEGNLLTGELPNELENLSSIRKIDLSLQRSRGSTGANSFFGNVPLGLCAIPSFEELVLTCQSEIFLSCPEECCTCIAGG